MCQWKAPDLNFKLGINDAKTKSIRKDSILSYRTSTSSRTVGLGPRGGLVLSVSKVLVGASRGLLEQLFCVGRQDF